MIREYLLSTFSIFLETKPLTITPLKSKRLISKKIMTEPIIIFLSLSMQQPSHNFGKATNYFRDQPIT